MRFDVLPVLTGDGRRVSDAALREAGRRLDAGELLVHPTGTLYGIGGAPLPAVGREIARLKGRDPERPLVHLAPERDAVRRRSGLRWDERAERVAAAFWPGPLTLVLEDGSEHGLAVRVDPHPVIRSLLAPGGRWLTSTSVNRSGEPPATGPAAVRACLAGFPPSVRRVTLLDAGELPRSDPSTLLSLRERPARVLRSGAVPEDRLREALGETETVAGGPAPEERRPG